MRASTGRQADRYYIKIVWQCFGGCIGEAGGGGQGGDENTAAGCILPGRMPMYGRR